MANDIDNGYLGDSARNKFDNEIKTKIWNHVFDGAGENVQCHSDSESTSSKKRTRYINPAICIEPVEETHSATSLQTDSSSCIKDITPHPHSSYRSNSTPFLTGRVSSSASSSSIIRKSCRLHDNAHDNLEFLEEPTPRNDRTYRDDGHDTFRLSVASVSTSATAKEERARNEQKKQEAFKQWLARKEQDKREKIRLNKKLKQQVSHTTTREQREESYRRWLERKRTQTEQRRAEELMRTFQEKERLEQERYKKQRDKDEKLAEWFRKKEEDLKAIKNRTERAAARSMLEEQRRRADGERAYRDWLRTSKNKPLPVPLNQGELSMRGSVSEMYINPTPWQSP